MADLERGAKLYDDGRRFEKGLLGNLFFTLSKVVTRIYASTSIYEKNKKMHLFHTALSGSRGVEGAPAVRIPIILFSLSPLKRRIPNFWNWTSSDEKNSKV